jgi:ATP-dependent 26S proteasome regulatory subunit
MLSFDDVAGLTMQKQVLTDNLLLPLQKKELYAQLVRSPEKVREQNTFLFTGPPGSGKTYLAKALASEMAMPFTSVSSTELLDSYLGAGAKKIRELYQTQEGIIFIDELDAVAQKRTAGNEIKQDVLIELLFCLDGTTSTKPYATIAATNRPESLDAAISSRFAHTIPFQLPDIVQRTAIAKKQLSYYVTKEINLNEIIFASEGLDARQLCSAIDGAKTYALSDDRAYLQSNDVLLAIQNGYR